VLPLYVFLHVTVVAVNMVFDSELNGYTTEKTYTKSVGFLKAGTETFQHFLYKFARIDLIRSKFAEVSDDYSSGVF